MPPKKTTPYQFKKGLTYVKKVPNFLQGLTSHTNDYIDDEQKASEDFSDKEPSDDELNATREEERPQIVVLKEGKHMSEGEVRSYLDSRRKSKEKDSSLVENKESDIDDNIPTVDEKTGKILFRKPKTKNTNKSETVVGSHSKAKNESKVPIKAINEVIDGMKRKRNNEIKNDKSGKKPKTAKKKSQSHLSFSNDEIL
ncbi:hypothetical protein RhiirA4_468804 [Rhizophagus irregularis]|uniref:DUF4604 domain-containing protein n=1 Tax=Rhizophagus irregularis TaxID=588596 RepID=A0A2I1GYD9_9GLOM|nr:hypothetical protein RhiirA4_468804 [Rhizophagus irregularis]